LLPPTFTTLRCPSCNTDAVVRERFPKGLVAGWVCWKQRKGCGTVYIVNDPDIVAQLSPEEIAVLKASILRQSGLREKAPPPAAPKTSEDPAVPAKWEEIRERLRAKMKPDQWKIWIEVIVPLRFEEQGETMVLLSPHPGHAQWLMENHGDVFGEAVKASGLAAFKIEFAEAVLRPRGLPL
jgi:hypothetical protein